MISMCDQSYYILIILIQVRHALKESLSKGEGKATGRLKNRTSPPGSAPGTPRTRKRKGKALDANPPSKLARSASYDPTMARGVSMMPGSPMVAASQGASSPHNVDNYQPYSPITPASSADSPHGSDMEGSRTQEGLTSRPVPPLTRIDSSPRPPFPQPGGRMPLQNMKGLPLVSVRSPRVTLMGKPPATISRSPASLTSKDVSSAPLAAQTASRTSVPPASVVVSEADGKMVLTVPVEMDVNRGQPLPKQILPPIAASSPGIPKSPARPTAPSATVKSDKDEADVSASTIKSGTYAKSQTSSRDIASSKEETPLSKQTVTPTRDHSTPPVSVTGGDKSNITQDELGSGPGIHEDISDTESSDSFMIDESNTETCNDSSSPGATGSQDVTAREENTDSTTSRDPVT